LPISRSTSRFIGMYLSIMRLLVYSLSSFWLLKVGVLVTCVYLDSVHKQVRQVEPFKHARRLNGKVALHILDKGELVESGPASLFGSRRAAR